MTMKSRATSAEAVELLHFKDVSKRVYIKIYCSWPHTLFTAPLSTSTLFIFLNP